MQGTGKRNRRVRQRQEAFQKECFCVTVSSGLKNFLLDKGRDLGCLKKETAASPHQASPQDQDGIPGCSQLFHTFNHPSLILRCDFLVVRWLRSIHTSVTSSPHAFISIPKELIYSPKERCVEWLLWSVTGVPPKKSRCKYKLLPSLLQE